MKNAYHSIAEETHLTNNGELETCEGQLLLIQHQPRLRTYLTVLYVIYNTVTVKTEFEFFSVKQNTVEEFEFESQLDE